MAIWELDGKTIYDFSSQLDYEIEDTLERLELVNKILGQRQLHYNGEPLFKDKKDPNYDKRMNAYDDFYSTYFSSTPKFDYSHLEEFVINFEDRERQSLDQSLNPPVEPPSKSDYKKYNKIIHLLEMKENEDVLTKNEMKEYRKLINELVYQGDKYTKVRDEIKEYDYRVVKEQIKELSSRDDLSKEEKKKLAHLNELKELLKMDERTEKQEKRLALLSNKYANKVLFQVRTGLKRDTTSFPNYTPLIGTANEVNMKQVVSNLKPLSEHDYVCKSLAQMATYLLKDADDIIKERTQKDREEKSDTLSDKEDYEIKTKKDMYKSRKIKIYRSDSDYFLGKYKRLRMNKSKFPRFLEIDRSESRKETENKMMKNIYDCEESLNLLRQIVLSRQHVGSLDKVPQREIYKLKRWIGDIRANQLEIKKSQHRYIDMRMLLKSSTIVDFERDTGYIDKNGEYVHITDNKIDFKDRDHIAGILSYYKSNPNAVEQHMKDINSDLFYIFSLLHVLINKSDFSPIEKKIIRWYLVDDLPITTTKDDLPCDTILKRLEQNGHQWDASRVSRFLTQTVPKTIADKYKDSMEDWIYTYKIKGEYKTCTKCGKTKLKSRFGISKNRKDGLQPYCRQCR